MSSAKLKKNYSAENKNIISHLRSNMSLQELRIFSIYLAKINPLDLSSRVVRFKISEFQRVLGLGRLNINHLNNTADSLLSKILYLPSEDETLHTTFPLFKSYSVFQDDYIWFFEMDAHDDALPLILDFKENYFTYKLWNVLNLKSSNQILMYENLKYWQRKREILLSLDDIKNMLGLELNQYQRWTSLRNRILDPCQKALKEYTDIEFTYEPLRKGIGKGVGRMITHVNFFIKKNTNFAVKPDLKNFLKHDPVPDHPITEFSDTSIEDLPLFLSNPDEYTKNDFENLDNEPFFLRDPEKYTKEELENLDIEKIKEIYCYDISLLFSLSKSKS